MRYEITIELPNGDWRWKRYEVADLHECLTAAIAFASTHEGARVHHLEKLPSEVVTPAVSLVLS